MINKIQNQTVRSQIITLSNSDILAERFQIYSIIREHLPAYIDTFEEVDHYYLLNTEDIFFGEFLADIGIDLYNEGLEDESYWVKRIELVRWVYTQFTGENSSVLGSFRVDEAKSLWDLGKIEEAEAKFQFVIENYPDLVDGYLVYGDCFWLDDNSLAFQKPDYQRAKEIYQLGMERLETHVSSLIEERMEDIEEEIAAPSQREQILAKRIQFIQHRQKADLDDPEIKARLEAALVSPVDPDTKDYQIRRIMKKFLLFDYKYKKQEIDHAIEMKEEIIPELIKVLERALAEPEAYINESKLYHHIYALMLLAHFREQRAHQVIIDLFSLPDEIPHEMFGDIVTSSLSAILLQTCGDSIETIKAFAANPSVNNYCRSAGAIALVFSVMEGCASREEILSFLGDLLLSDTSEEQQEFRNLLVHTVCYLRPEEIIDQIREAFDQGFLEQGFPFGCDLDGSVEMSWEDWKYAINDMMSPMFSDDFHAKMQWWNAFRDDRRTRNSAFSRDVKSPSSGTIYRKKDKKKKNKRKQAKASKKKNRR